jgi:fructose-1,6-bisphosphatase/inositol monophosphatase family enzyme
LINFDIILAIFTPNMKIPDPEQICNIMEECSLNFLAPMFGRLSEKQVWRKPNNSVVTSVDIQAEEFLRRRLKQLIPGSSTVGEEEAGKDPSILERLESDRPLWIIDALDGTRNFVNGVDCYAVLVALFYKREIVAGWIFLPAKEDSIWGMKGEGAWHAGYKIEFDPFEPKENTELKGFLGNRLAKIPDISDNFKAIKSYGCVGSEYFDLALGLSDFAYYRRINPWDHCAGTIIVKEVSGYVGELESGREYKPSRPPENGIVVASSHAVYARVSAVLARNID